MGPPDLLFKYTSATTAEIVLETQTLRWSRPDKFNDPTEFQRVPLFKPTLNESYNYFIDILAESCQGRAAAIMGDLSPSARKLFQLLKLVSSDVVKRDAIIKNLKLSGPDFDEIAARRIYELIVKRCIEEARVMCLSADPINTAMWTHYADGHAGCVIGFRHLPEKDTVFQTVKIITYANYPEPLTCGADFFLYGNTANLSAQVLNGICFTKSIHWEYEQEWRAIWWELGGPTREYMIRPFYSDEIESITFGLNAKPQFVEGIKGLVRLNYQSCQMFRIVNSGGALSKIPVD